MKSTNIILFSCICALLGGSVATASFNTQEITQPKKANENLLEFNLTLNEGTVLHDKTNKGSGIEIYNRKAEYTGYNNALKANMEFINQTTTQSVIDLTTNTTTYQPILSNETTNNNNALIKYEITPYQYLYESKTNQKIYTRIKLQEYRENTILNFKITILTSYKDWSQYMAQTNWYVEGNNKNIIDEIKNPNNEQTFNEKIQIKQLELTTDENLYIEITTELEIINNQKNYQFILIEPYINQNSTNTYQNLITTNPYVFMFIEQENLPTISGYMIPPINDYEVIDIPEIMWNILTMPFAFISTAFNLTIFPGTPYQINISNLFLTILAILIFVWIVKVIFKR